MTTPSLEQDGFTAKHPHKTIWSIAAPAILANSSAPLVGLVDTWAIGHMPDALYLAAVGLGGAIFSYIFWTLGFLRMGTTGLVAQAYGQKDTTKITEEVTRAAILSLILAAVILVFQTIFRDGLLQLLSAPEEIKDLTISYFNIRIWATPATLFFLVLNGFFIGTARLKLVLWLQLLLNVSNAILNIWLVVFLNMGVVGVAIGTLIAEWLAAIVGLFMLFRYIKFQDVCAAFLAKKIWVVSRFKAVINVNGFIFLRTIFLLLAFALFTKGAAELGTEDLAVTHVMLQYLLLMSLGLDGFANAGEALVGAAYGAGDRGAFVKWVRLTLFWAGLAGMVYAVFFLVFGNFITAALTDIAIIRQGVHDLMPFVALMPLVSFWCYQFDGIYIGMTAAPAMFYTMLMSFFFYGVAYLYLPQNYGVLGLWLTLMVLMASRGALQAIWYHWRLKKF